MREKIKKHKKNIKVKIFITNLQIYSYYIIIIEH